MLRSTVLVVIGVVGFWACSDPPVETSEPQALECSTESNLALFEQRIKPLMAPDRPVSCERCHLPGTDFGRYMQSGNACKTMACLVSEELVDLEAPDESKILGWILRGHERFAGPLTTDALVQGEYDAFREWIVFSAECDACEEFENPCGHPPDPDPDLDPDPDPDPDPEPDPEPPPELIEENYPCAEQGVVRSFTDHIWPERGRCNHCHAEVFRAPENATKWMAAGSSLEAAQQTVDLILSLGLVDFQDPHRSLVVLKPLHEDDGGIPHEGGAKAVLGDAYDTTIRQWVDLAATCQSP